MRVWIPQQKVNTINITDKETEPRSRGIITNSLQKGIVQKSKDSKYSPDLSQEEIDAIERFESDKGEYSAFDNPKDAIKWLQGKNPKSKK